MEEYKTQHLEFIQNCIARMTTNSFHIRGLEITIVSALLAIYASTSSECFIFWGIIPILLFWFLDTSDLQLEQKFRGVYDIVTEINMDSTQLLKK